MQASSQQCLLDPVFGAMRDTTAMVRGISDRAFAKGRSHLRLPALSALNDQVIALAESASMVPRWQGQHLVAGDAGGLMPADRRCERTQHLAGGDQRLFARYLPGAEPTLHAAGHSASESERAMLANGLDKLSAADVLLLDRGYTAAWQVKLLSKRDLEFVIRCAPTSALHILQRPMPRLLLPLANLTTVLGHTLSMIARSLKRPQLGRTKPRADVRSTPHPNLAYKG